MSLYLSLCDAVYIVLTYAIASPEAIFVLLYQTIKRILIILTASALSVGIRSADTVSIDIDTINIDIQYQGTTPSQSAIATYYISNLAQERKTPCPTQSLLLSRSDVSSLIRATPMTIAPLSSSFSYNTATTTLLPPLSTQVIYVSPQNLTFEPDALNAALGTMLEFYIPYRDVGLYLDNPSGPPLVVDQRGPQKIVYYRVCGEKPYVIHCYEQRLVGTETQFCLNCTRNKSASISYGTAKHRAPTTAPATAASSTRLYSRLLSVVVATSSGSSATGTAVFSTAATPRPNRSVVLFVLLLAYTGIYVFGV